MRWIAALLTLIPAVALAAGLCSTESINAAQRSYDLGAAISVLEACELEAPIRTDDVHRELVARAALLVAELHRIDFETVDTKERSKRRHLGTLIDEAADEGLESLKGLLETSERLRLKADLLATKIRSDFRAKKYGKKMKAAAARALELNPKNSRAVVSQAKPLLFAETRHGGDLDEAIRLLGEALALKPTLESALLLRALAYERQGQTEASRKDLQAALAANPQCRPARERLQTR
ncbi:MAG: tetratricopeptide repeat protein [Acidobacteria bacterium]|nr:tetratricopeptide repeat protein [Acidobacteriota bacterium]